MVMRQSCNTCSREVVTQLCSFAGTCDVCAPAAGTSFSEVDVTVLARSVVGAVHELNHRNIQKDLESAVAQLEVWPCPLVNRP